MNEKERADREKATGILSELIGFEKSWICQIITGSTRSLSAVSLEPTYV